MERQPYTDLGHLILHKLGSKSVTWLAEQCGVSRPAASQWLTGKTRPERWRIRTVALALGLTQTEIIRVGQYEEGESDRVITLGAVSSDDVERAKNDVKEFLMYG